LLAKQKHLISFLNQFIDKEIDFRDSSKSNRDLIQIFQNIIKFLLSLVHGSEENETEIIKDLSQTLHIESLIK